MVTTRICVLVFILLILIPAHTLRAEWLWNDAPYLQMKFENFIKENISKDCNTFIGSELFGYQSAFSRRDGNEIVYEMVVRLPKSCFKKLEKKLLNIKNKGGIVIAGVKKSHRLFTKFDADGGPTVIFYFRATKQEMDQIDN